MYARLAAGPPFTTTRRSGVKTSVASSPRSCSADRRAAPSSRARFGSVALRLTETVTGTGPRWPVSSILATVAPCLISCMSERVRGENPWVPDVERLEEVRLPGAVCARHENEPRLELELEPGIRPEVAKRDSGDDQPASLIGMIRYQNESSSVDVIRPGRRGLISFSLTVSLRTESTPSARNSALKPISSGSPV